MTKWSYNNTGFIILGRVVEKVSGIRFGRISRCARIFTPLQMRHSTYEPDYSDPQGLARGYTSFALSGPEDAPGFESKGWLGAAGGIFLLIDTF